MNPAGSGSDCDGSSLTHLASAKKDDGSDFVASNLAKAKGHVEYNSQSVLCNNCACHRLLQHNMETRYCYNCHRICGEDW